MAMKALYKPSELSTKMRLRLHCSLLLGSLAALHKPSEESQLYPFVRNTRKGLKNTEPDILGRAYEYLLRKFAEGQGQSAGEFYTPKEVGWLLDEIINPAPKTTVYDPACGSGGLLIKARLLYQDRHQDTSGQAPRLFGQEINPTTFAMAKMNMFLLAQGSRLVAPAAVAHGQPRPGHQMAASLLSGERSEAEGGVPHQRQTGLSMPSSGITRLACLSS